MEGKIDFLRVLLCILMIELISCSEWKPILVDKSLDKRHYTNVKIMIFCKFNATPTANVSWIKDGKAVVETSRVRFGLFMQGANKAVNIYQLTIERSQEGDKGKYVCSAKNGLGVAEGIVSIDIIPDYAPKISNIQDAILFVGQKFRTRCTADALPYASYSWQKKSAFIDKRRVQDVGDGQLVFVSVRNADHGEYTCIATNSVGESMESFKVRVVSNPSWITSLVNQTEIFNGDFVTLSALFTGSQDKLSINWYKDGEVFPQSKQEVLAGGNGTFTRTSLTFDKAGLQDNGLYKLVVSNEEGSISTKTQLIVYSKPQVAIREGANVTVRFGDTLILLCTVNSFPESVVMWMFNGTIMASIGNVKPSSSRSNKRTVELAYAIRDAKRVDRGYYFCIGRNREGESKSVVSVMVKDISSTGPGGVKKAESSSKLIIIIACIAVLFIICIIVVTVFLIRYQRRKSALPPVAYSAGSGSKESGLNIGTEAALRSGSFSGLESGASNHEHPLLKNDQQEKGTHKRPLLSKYRRGTASKSPSEENILPGHGIPLDAAQIKHGAELGSGSFGCTIRKGEVEIEGEFKAVVIKKLDKEADEGDKICFHKELEILKKLSHHPNIIGLVGWVGSGDDLEIVTEFGNYGTLLNFLRTFKKGLYMNTLKSDTPCKLDFELNEKDLISFGWQIASGMKYLSSMGIVHRDLAARNVLLGHQHVCKIINFGIDKKNIYGNSTVGEPLKWMGFESIFKEEFSMKSDVWSFGVVLWEITTLGDYPYPGFSTPDELINALKGGYRMDRPVHCSEALYEVMMSCWQQSPAHRPDFGQLCSKAGSMLCDFETHIDFELLKQSFKESEGWEEAL